MKRASALCEISPGSIDPVRFLCILAPELKSEVVGQGVSATTVDDSVNLQISCHGIPDLRAALNSYLHWFHTIREVEMQINER